MTDAFDIDVVVTRKPWPERKTLFRCLLCNEDIFGHASMYGHAPEREPICKSCTRHWGSKSSGPVFNRKNYHAIKQLSAMITRLTWEVRNGDRRYRY